MIVLTYRDGGMTRAEPIPDDTAAPARARVIAEMFGECMVYGVTSLDKVVHGAAVPHAQIPLDPERILPSDVGRRDVRRETFI